MLQQQTQSVFLPKHQQHCHAATVTIVVEDQNFRHAAILSSIRQTDTLILCLGWQECDKPVKARLACDTDIRMKWIVFGLDRDRPVN